MRLLLPTYMACPALLSPTLVHGQKREERGGKALLLLGEERGGGKRFRSRDKTTEEEGREGNGAFFATAGVKVKKKKMARRMKGGRGQVGTHLGVLKF